MYDLKHSSKIKNDKIQRWRIELSCFSFDVVYRPGLDNLAADALSRTHCASLNNMLSIKELHDNLCHPGVVRLLHFVRARNLPFSVDDVKRTVSQCEVCAELKPRFCKISTGNMIKATAPFERLNVDFKGPLPSATRNRYLLTIVDEYSRFPFAFPCSDMTSGTVISCFIQLFSLFGSPSYVHSDRGSSFMSEDVKQFLHKNGIATSRTTAYNPQANGQVERMNGTLWRCLTLATKSNGLPITQWERVLNDALHSMRSLLCTSTNSTPHERFFSFNRKSASGITLPSWLSTPGPVLLRRHVRSSKYDPFVDEVELLECNPKYAHVRLQDGREETVSIHHLAPKGNARHEDLVLDNTTDDNHQPLVHEADVFEPSDRTNADIAGENQPANEKSILEQQQRTRPYNLRNREA